MIVIIAIILSVLRFKPSECHKSESYSNSTTIINLKIATAH